MHPPEVGGQALLGEPLLCALVKLLAEGAGQLTRLVQRRVVLEDRLRVAHHLTAGIASAAIGGTAGTQYGFFFFFFLFLFQVSEQDSE